MVPENFAMPRVHAQGLFYLWVKGNKHEQIQPYSRVRRTFPGHALAILFLVFPTHLASRMHGRRVVWQMKTCATRYTAPKRPT